MGPERPSVKVRWFLNFCSDIITINAFFGLFVYITNNTRSVTIFTGYMYN